jgi:hypothetical protein
MIDIEEAELVQMRFMVKEKVIRRNARRRVPACDRFQPMHC